jgi:RNA polymerase sigma factor (TIGR02999 family)
MRRVLVDCARLRKAKKRWSEARRVELGPDLVAGQRWDEELLDIHAALNKLARIDLRAAQIVELRFFGGLGEAEIAKLFGISERTVKRDWEMTRAWLEIELSAYAKDRRGPNNGNH